MLSRPSAHQLSPILLSFLLIAGCASKPTGPTTYPIAGVVTQDEKPVAGAFLQFLPTGADYKPLAAGVTAIGGQATTAEDGSYAVESTFDRGKTTVRGLPAGAYAVTIVKMEVPQGPASLNSPPKNVLEPRYASVDTTPVKVTITPDGQHEVDIPL